MYDEPLKKSEGSGAVERSRPRTGAFVSLLAMVPGFALCGLVIGVGSRITLIMFEWGWDLFGWAV